MYQKIERILSSKLNEDIGKLLLRVSVSILMLFHGYSKISNGVDNIVFGLVQVGIPGFLAYCVYLGEVIFPILIIIGLCARLAAIGMGSTMMFAIFLVFSDKLFILNNHGAPIIELPLLYLILSITIFLIGPGKYSFDIRVRLT